MKERGEDKEKGKLINLTSSQYMILSLQSSQRNVLHFIHITGLLHCFAMQ